MGHYQARGPAAGRVLPPVRDWSRSAFSPTLARGPGRDGTALRYGLLRVGAGQQAEGQAREHSGDGLPPPGVRRAP